MKVIRVVAGITVGFLCLVSSWTVAYLVTAWLYRLLGENPGDYVRQIVVSVLGLFLIGAVISIFSPRKRQTALWQSLMDAMRQIAKGNFNVKVPIESWHARSPNPFGQLVHTVNDMASQLQEMEQMRQEFISNISHEIQSPLTSIAGFAKVLKQEDLTPEERTHYLDIIETESLRLSKLSENLLKLTALESEHPPFAPKPYRLDRQIRTIVLSCEPQWTAKQLDMEVDLEETTMVADEDLMSQVWVNLLHNSIKFTPGGGRIGISLENRESAVMVRISDTGIGISAKDQARIFERFFKADKSRNRAMGGSGLGLSIVKKIVDMHQGSIQVESRLGEGTTFTVRLPTQQPAGEA